ncbi:unnamed protein product [Rotaria sordida]|uniref:HMG box domain-containing protein n=1 Tax=Rotaria sordida TaxID=392033 RepID=A0A814DQ01_9BILA|nr:unnamed protein product [Rotaria sordida]CAF1028021.1 unnamed protein product [Rotaria sordida]CAF1035392.1 unnamed protein product [Rotaria sordida]CAF3668313.1 unnamed protein product [Rotaria sordida]CAF3710433.1 unnamed protein product [Rotaria sordida]
MVFPTIQSKDFQTSNENICSSSLSTNSNEITTKIKIEDDIDEIKIFSVSTLLNNESYNDHDYKKFDIEERLSPVIEESTSPNKNDSLNNNISGLYTTPFFYPYFHPYFIAATAQMNSSADKISINEQTNNPFGVVSPFPGIPFLPFYPPGMMNQSFQSNFFNPFGIPIPISGVYPSSSSNRQHQSSIDNEQLRGNLNTLVHVKRSKKPHIKKPLNAFMIYMKEQRAHIIEECALKESSAINKILGQKWKELSRSEQDRYYELAKEERNRHMQMYPNWSARDNYGIKKKRQIGRIQKNDSQDNDNSLQKNSTNTSKQFDNDCLNLKKCRARYGLEGLNQWCKHCRRKKKCTKFLEDDLSNPRTLGNSSSNGNPSSVSSIVTFQSDEDSINNPDSDDILSRQIDSIQDEHDDSNEENKQQFYLPSSTLPLNFVPNFRY